MNDQDRRILSRLRGKIIERYGEIADKGHKAIYQDDAVRIEKSQWNRKFHGEVKFNTAEIERLRSFFRAPAGWPYVDWDAPEARGQAEPTQTPSPKPAAPPAQPGRRKRAGH